MSRHVWLAAPIIAASVLVPSAAHAGVETWTRVLHGETEVVDYLEDICGPRANTTTYTRTVEVQHFTGRGDGTYVFHFTDVVRYFSDFDDPEIADQSGRLTEVGTFVLTPGETFTQTLTFHDFLGKDIKIFERGHLTLVDGVPTVERSVSGYSGCP